MKKPYTISVRSTEPPKAPVYNATGLPVKIGDKVRLRNDTEDCEVSGWREPHKPSSSGFVYVKYADGSSREFYITVIDAHFIRDES